MPRRHRFASRRRRRRPFAASFARACVFRRRPRRPLAASFASFACVCVSRRRLRCPFAASWRRGEWVPAPVPAPAQTPKAEPARPGPRARVAGSPPSRGARAAQPADSAAPVISAYGKGFGDYLHNPGTRLGYSSDVTRTFFASTCASNPVPTVAASLLAGALLAGALLAGGACSGCSGPGRGQGAYGIEEDRGEDLGADQGVPATSTSLRQRERFTAFELRVSMLHRPTRVYLRQATH